MIETCICHLFVLQMILQPNPKELGEESLRRVVDSAAVRVLVGCVVAHLKLETDFVQTGAHSLLLPLKARH